MGSTGRTETGSGVAVEALEVDLLGPVRARYSGQSLELPRGRSRHLIALLAVRRRPISPDELCAEMWPQGGPADPRHALENLVSRLRRCWRVLAEDELLVLRSTGYQLSRVVTDVDEVEDALARGVAAVEDGDVETALQVLNAAETRWRGAPFGGVTDVASLTAEAERLVLLRRRLHDARFDAAIAAGAHEDVLRELASDVAEDPLDERRRGQLMVALYRSGRQAEALAVYREGAHHLREELGVDPGAELQRLHVRMLQHDRVLTGSGAPSEGAVHEEHPLFGRDLPRPRTSFVGRERDLAEVAGAIRGGSLVTLTGPGGSGKTRLAIEVAHRCVSRFRDGAAFVDLVAVETEGQITTTVARTIGASGHRSVEASTTATEDVVSSLKGRQALLVLDNCEHVLRGTRVLADLVLDEAPGVALLATSREALGVEGEQRWHVRPLHVHGQDPEALTLLQQRLASVRPELQDSDALRATLLRVCRELDGLPLALEFAAARMADLPPEEVANRLDDRLHLLRADAASDRRATLQRVLDWSYRLLDDDERWLFRRLSTFAGDFDIASVEGVGSDEDRAAIDLLASLHRKSLVSVSPRSASNYRLLETVRMYAATKLREHHEEGAARTAHRGWHLDWVESFPFDQRLLSPEVTHAFAERYADLRVAMERAWDTGDHDDVARFVCGLTGTFLFDLHPSEGDGWFDRLRTSAALGRQRRVEVDVHRTFIDNHRFGGDPSYFAMLADRTRDAVRVLPDGHHALTMAWWNLAGLEHALGFDTAIISRAAREVIERSADGHAPLLEAYGHILIAHVAVIGDDIQSAAAALDRAESLRRSVSSRLLEVLTLERSVVAHLSGEHGAALALLDELRPQARGQHWDHLIAIIEAVCLTARGDQVRASRVLADAWTGVSSHRWQHPLVAFDCVLGLAAIEAINGNHERASELLSAVRQNERVLLSLPLLTGLYRRTLKVVRKRGVPASVLDRASPETILDEALHGTAQQRHSR